MSFKHFTLKQNVKFCIKPSVIFSSVNFQWQVFQVFKDQKKIYPYSTLKSHPIQYEVLALNTCLLSFWWKSKAKICIHQNLIFKLVKIIELYSFCNSYLPFSISHCTSFIGFNNKEINNNLNLNWFFFHTQKPKVCQNQLTLCFNEL